MSTVYLYFHTENAVEVVWVDADNLDVIPYKTDYVYSRVRGL